MDNQPSTAPIYQLRVALRGITPPIWRRFQFPGANSFLDLHLALQAIMGWRNSHLYQFNVGQIELTDAETAAEFGASDAETTALNELVRRRGTKFRYLYDFGDSWEHDLEVEEIQPPQQEVAHPRCLAGSRACPPEDSGGAWSYSYFLEDLAAGQLDDDGESEFDPEAFDIELANKRLRRAFPRAGTQRR